MSEYNALLIVGHFLILVQFVQSFVIELHPALLLIISPKRRVAATAQSSRNAIGSD
jgi:hypothetical protein